MTYLALAIDRPIAFVDLETTGTSTERDRVVELALLIIQPDGTIGAEKVRRINPGVPIPEGASKVHGIRDEDVRDEPTFGQIARSLADVLEGCDLAGFNINSFDLPLLVKEFRRAGVSFDVNGRRLIDLQVIFHTEEPRDLTAAAKRYAGLDHTQAAHAANADVRVCIPILNGQLAAYDHLPRDVAGLHDYIAERRPYLGPVHKWFDSPDDNPVFRQGKHSGEDLRAVARDDPLYLDWMLNKAEDIHPDVRQLVFAALNGRAI